MSLHDALQEAIASPRGRIAFDAIFGGEGAHAAFLIDEHLERVCGAAVQSVRFIALDKSIAFGLVLTDDQQVVLKAHGKKQSATHVLAAYAAQSGLAESGFALTGGRPIAPSVLDMRSVGDMVMATMVLRDEGEVPKKLGMRYRKVIAETLVSAVEHLSDLTAPMGLHAVVAREGARYPGLDEDGPRPQVPAGQEAIAGTLEVLASWSARLIAQTAPSRYVIGHCDWSARHMRFVPGRAEISVVYGWDALAHVEELLCYTRAAAAFAAQDAPSLDAVRGFLSDVEVARKRGFSGEEQLRLAAFVASAVAARGFDAVAAGSEIGDAHQAAAEWLSALEEKNGAPHDAKKR